MLLALLGVFGVACTCGSSESDDSGCGGPLKLGDAGGTGGYGHAGWGGSGWGGGVLDASAGGGGDPSCDVDAGVVYDGSTGTCVPDGCVFGLADCNNAIWDGCEVDVAKNGAHCGRCSKTCSQGCDYASCFGPEVAVGEDVTAFAVEPDGIYYATQRPCCSIMHKVGKASPIPLLVGEPGIAELVVEQGQVFFRRGGLEVQGMTSGSSFVGMLRPTPLGMSVVHWSAPIALSAIAMDADWVYYAGTDPSPQAHLFRAAHDGTGEEVVLTRPGAARALARVGQELILALSNPGVIMRVDTTTLAMTELASGGFDPVRITTSEGFVYIADQVGQQLLRVSVAGGTLETTASLNQRPFAVAHSAGKLWYTTAEPVWLMEYAPAGDVELAGLVQPNAPVTHDGQFLYWASPGAGILRLKR